MHKLRSLNPTLRISLKPLASAMLSLGILCSAPGVLAQAASADGHDFAALAQADQFWPYFNDYCTECHNYDDFSGGVDFTAARPADVAGDAELYETVLKKLRGRMMPPPNKIRPDEARTDAFVAWMESYLDEAGRDDTEMEHVVIHRLNRREYANAVRDLFAIEVKPSDILPTDPTADGFDNIADALQVSPAFVNQYVSAARSVAEQVIGDPTPSLGSVAYKAPQVLPARAIGGGSQQFHIEGLPLGTRGGMLVEHWFPADGEYAVNVGDFDLSAWMYNIEFENKMIVTLDGVKIHETILGGDKDRIALDLDQGEPLVDMNSRTKDIRFTTTAGPHKVGVTFVRRTFAESDDRLQHFIPGAVQDRILTIPSVELRGPYVAGGISTTPAREKIFSCYPQQPSEEDLCAEEIITNIATRAYRRPLTNDDMAPLMEFFIKGKAVGGFEEGLRQALTRTLASPNFLYRAEVAPANLDPGAIYPVSSLDLASRLSFFLWSSVPDDELLETAIADKLTDPAVLESQVKRMLADPRSKSLAENFASQWLKLDKLDELAPDEKIFPYASGPGDLRPDFREELALFIDSVFREDQSIMRLMDADYTYLNERLALHYGINNVKGDRFRRVELENRNRWGLLGKGGILMATAYPNRTSPVLRGAWILETIMGTPPPVPPPNVEALPEDAAGSAATTVRARLEQHRANPTCNSCHSVMDPLGFALDNFDAVGKWRDRDRYTSEPVDASGIMPNGSLVNGPEDLRAALMTRPNLFGQSLTEKLMTYALGRPMEAHDMPTVRKVVSLAAEDDYRFSTLVMSIIGTNLFQMNKVPEVASTGNAGDVALSSQPTPTN